MLSGFPSDSKIQLSHNNLLGQIFFFKLKREVTSYIMTNKFYLLRMTMVSIVLRIKLNLV